MYNKNVVLHYNILFIILILTFDVTYPRRSKLSPAHLFSHGSDLSPTNKEDQHGEALAATMMTPIQTKALALDFRETDQRFELDIDFPGMKKDEISVKTDGNVLTISGERKFTNEKDEGKYHKIER